MPGGWARFASCKPLIRQVLDLSQGEAFMKKSYERPAVLHTEKLEARAVVCSKADSAACAAGPIQS